MGPDNGEETYGWRIRHLETRVDRIEAKIQAALYMLIANLVGVVLMLVQGWLK